MPQAKSASTDKRRGQAAAKGEARKPLPRSKDRGDHHITGPGGAGAYAEPGFDDPEELSTGDAKAKPH